MERTGFRLQGSSLPLPQLVDAARLVESHGYEVMFVTRSSFMEMAVLGYETQRVLVGPGVATVFTSSVTDWRTRLQRCTGSRTGGQCSGLEPATRTRPGLQVFRFTSR
jgi:hypothetical protein